MRRDWFAIAGISLACVTVWSLLIFAFFRSDVQEVDFTAGNEEMELYHLGEEATQEKAHDSSFEPLVEDNNDPAGLVMDEEEFSENDYETISTDSFVEREDKQEFSLDNLHVRGIQKGDFDYIAAEGIISIDVILKEILK